MGGEDRVERRPAAVIASRAVRVAIDPGSHHVLNLGDVAMLQVAVKRLGEIWPGAHIDVLTTDRGRAAFDRLPSLFARRAA